MVQRLEAEGAEVVFKFFESFSVDEVELGSASAAMNIPFVFVFFLPFCLIWDQIFRKRNQDFFFKYQSFQNLCP